MKYILTEQEYNELSQTAEAFKAKVKEESDERYNKLFSLLLQDDNFNKLFYYIPKEKRRDFVYELQTVILQIKVKC